MTEGHLKLKTAVLVKMWREALVRYDTAVQEEDWSLAATRQAYANGLYQALVVIDNKAAISLVD